MTFHDDLVAVLSRGRNRVHIEHIGRLDELEAAWRNIEARRSALPVFQSWLWNSTWARTVMPAMPGATLRCHVLLSDAGRELAIVPCFSRPLLGGALTIGRWLGDRMSFLHDVICESPDDHATAEAVLAGLGETFGAREIVHLKHMSGASAFTRVLLARNLAELQCHRLVVSREDGDADPLRRLSRKRRKAHNWQLNRLRKLFGSCEARVAPLDEAPVAFERLVALHRSRFEARGVATLLDGANLDFTRQVFSRLCRDGRAEIFQLRVGDQPIAALLGLVDEGRYYFVNGGFDMSYEQFSPMVLLVTECMRHAFRRGCSHFELGPDYEAYKYRWRPATEASYGACLAGRGTVSRLGASVYQAAFRRWNGARSAPGRRPAASAA